MAFHWSKGAPFTGSDQDKYAKLTMWEQLDQGIQFSPTRKLLTVVPIVLYATTRHLICLFDLNTSQQYAHL